MPTPGQRLLATLERRLGCTEQPVGSNNGPCVREAQRFTYLRVPPPGEQGWPWCVAEWQRAVALTFGRAYPERTGAVWILADDALDRGLVVPVKEAVPGDAMCLGADHITVLVRRVGALRFVGRGGNQGNAVSDAEYPLSRVTTVISTARVAVLLEGKPKPKPRPKFEILRGPDGKEKQVAVVTGAAAARERVGELLRAGVRNVTIRRRKPGAP